MATLREAAKAALEAIENGESFDYLDNTIAPLLRAALVAKKMPLDKAQRAFLAELKEGSKKVSDMDTVVSRKALLAASRQLLKRGLIHIESFTFGHGEPSRVFALGPRTEKARVDRAQTTRPVAVSTPDRKPKARRDVAASWI